MCGQGLIWIPGSQHGQGSCIPNSKPNENPGCLNGDCAVFPDKTNTQCETGCDDPVTITWTDGLPQARISPAITKQYSLECLLSFGFLKAGISGGVDKGLDYAKKKAAAAGMSSVSGALGVATGPIGATIFGTAALSVIFKQCECTGK